METKIAVVETQVKNVHARLIDYWNDVRALRVAWNTITVFTVSLIVGGLIWLDNKQETKFFAVMNQLSENNVKMERMASELVKINHAVTAISQDHEKFNRQPNK
jgi:hypothetical protein